MNTFGEQFYILGAEIKAAMQNTTQPSYKINSKVLHVVKNLRDVSLSPFCFGDWSLRRSKAIPHASSANPSIRLPPEVTFVTTLLLQLTSYHCSKRTKQVATHNQLGNANNRSCILVLRRRFRSVHRS